MNVIGRWVRIISIFVIGYDGAGAAPLSGTVREASGSQAVIAGARVTVYSSDLTYFREVRTDAGGNYVVPDVPPGSYRTGASLPRYAYDERPVTVSASGATADFLLGPDTHPGRWSVIGDTAPEQFGASNSATLQTDGKVIFCHDTLDPIVFDPRTGAKTFAPSSHSWQGCHMTTLLSDGSVLFVGGQNSGDFRDAVKTVKNWNPASQTWTSMADLNQERWYPGLVRLADGALLSCGGGQRPNAQRTPTCELFDPDTRTWTPTDSLDLPTEYPPAVLLETGDVLLTWYPPQLFNTGTRTWSPTGNFVQADRNFPDHSDHSIVLLPDGRVMAVGIYKGTKPDPSMVELYDPTTGAWSLGPSPQTIRSRPEVVLLPGGFVLAAGGKKEDADPVPVNPWGQVKLTDIYDPHRGTWRRGADLVLAREYHATTLLVPDGRVITTGGTGEPGNPPSESSVEAYEPPYLFRGVRPRIDSLASDRLCSGSPAQMSVSRTSAVTDVVLMGTNSVTHWMDAGIPRHRSLVFSQTGSNVSFDLPASDVAAPQGWYLLFALVDDVPSEGRIVHLTQSVPEAVGALVLSGPGPTAVQWTSTRSGGTSVTYEIATGLLSAMRAAGNFDSGVCLASGLSNTQYTDPRTAPAPGNGYYYLVRARNDCFAGTYGSSVRDQHGIPSGGECP